MNQLGGFPLLTLIVLLPLMGALIGIFSPKDRRETWQPLMFLVAITNLFVSLFLPMGWLDDPLVTAQFVDGPRPWIAGLGVYYHLGVDGISVYLVLLTTLLTPLIMLASSRSIKDPGRAKRSTVWMLVFETGTLGALSALDLFLFSLFWLLAIVAAAVLIGEAAQDPRPMLYLWTAATCAGVLVWGVTVTISLFRSSLDLWDLGTSPVPAYVQPWLFWGMAVGLGIAGALFPLHLPLAWALRHPGRSDSALPMAQLLISSLLLDLTGYGLIRFCLWLFPTAATRFAPAMVALGALGMLYGAIAALGQRDLVSTMAYWNISQMGLTLSGIFSLENLGLQGAAMHMLARSLSVAALLLIASNPKDQQAKDLESSRPAGANRAGLALAFLSAIGVPGTAGFLGQRIVGLGLLGWLQAGLAEREALRWPLFVPVFAGALMAAWALLRAWRQVRLPRLTGVSRHAVLALPILFWILLLGLRPTSFLDVSGPSAHAILQEVRARAQSGRPTTLSPVSSIGTAEGNTNWLQKDKDRPETRAPGGFTQDPSHGECSQLGSTELLLGPAISSPDHWRQSR